jgi:hypothetical protein
MTAMSQPLSQSEERDCLIAVVNSDDDIARFLNDRWYRIPMRAIGRSIGKGALDESRILALYQTSTIHSGLPSAIELWGEIDDIRQLRRREIIPEESNHPAADELYQLIRVRNVERLERPVTSRRPRRVTFIRSSGERLFHAADMNDLIIGSAFEEKLWSAIREFDAERKYFMQAQGTVMEVDFAIFSEGRSVGIICGNEDGYDPSTVPESWSILRFSPGRLESEFADCMQELMTELRQMRNRTDQASLSDAGVAS